MLSRNAMMAIIAGIIAAAIAGAVAATSAPVVPAQQNKQTTGTVDEGKKITIDLNEKLGLKENS